MQISLFDGSETFDVRVVGNEYDNPEMLRWWEK
jgi:hypothetical protein